MLNKPFYIHFISYPIGHERLFHYIIRITTGSYKNSGTLSVTMFGQTSSSVELVLHHDDLESGSSVTFQRDIPTDLGTVEKIIIEQTKDEHDWFCEKVTVYCVTTCKHAYLLYLTFIVKFNNEFLTY